MNHIPLQRYGTQSVPVGIPTPERGNDEKVIQVPEFAVPFSSLYGGFGLKTATSVPLCTSGFAVMVTASAGTVRGIITSAHCPDALYAKGDGTIWRLQPYVSPRYGGSYDVQFNKGDLL